MEKLSAQLSAQSALGGGAGGARSYSDFMRSLAAKYNNNEYFTPATSGSSSPPAAAAAIKQDIFPFLGLGAFPQGFPGLPPGLLAGLPPGFNPFLPQDKAAGGGSGPLTPPLPPLKRARDQGDALDLTEKRVKTEAGGREGSSSPPAPAPRSPSPHPAAPLEGLPQDWSVDQVATFVMEIDICREYGKVFRDNKIDGGCLPLLTETHLTSGLGLKLGPALKLLTALRKVLGPSAPGCAACAHCHRPPEHQGEEGQ